MITSYRRLLTHRGVPSLLAIALVVRLSTPVLSLALLLAAVDRLDSYATAGLVLTGHALAVALCAPLGGRLADRYGAGRALTGYLIAHTLAYALVVLGLRNQPALMIAAAVLLGATTPPVGAVVRGAWPRLLPEAYLPAAYAVDNAVNELAFIAGPLLVSVLTLTMPAHGVVTAAGAALLLGTLLALTLDPVRHAPAARPSGPAGESRLRRLAGPLSHRPTLALLTIAAFGTFTFGTLRVATVASAATFGSAASAGVLIGLFSVGALAGNLGYGARAWPVTGRRILVVLPLAEAAALLGSGLAPGFATLAALITVTGLLTGPRDAVLQVLLAEHAPTHYRTEVFAWLNTFMWTGYGLGTAVAGHITGPHDSGAAALAAAAVAALAGATLAATAYPTAPAQRTP